MDETAIEVANVLGDSGFASIATDEIETLKWGKLLSNILNALEVLCGRDAMNDPLADRVLDEAVACLTAERR